MNNSPQEGPNLPPLIQGPKFAELSLYFHCLMWKEKKYFGKHCSIQVEFWGCEDGQHFSPPTVTKDDRLVIERSVPVVANKLLVQCDYPVVGMMKKALKYFDDMECLPMIVSVLQDDQSYKFVGQSFFHCRGIKAGQVLKKWCPVILKGEKTEKAEVLVSMSLQVAQPAIQMHVKSAKIYNRKKPNWKNDESNSKVENDRSMERPASPTIEEIKRKQAEKNRMQIELYEEKRKNPEKQQPLVTETKKPVIDYDQFGPDSVPPITKSLEHHPDDVIKPRTPIRVEDNPKSTKPSQESNPKSTKPSQERMDDQDPKKNISPPRLSPKKFKDPPLLATSPEQNGDVLLEQLLTNAGNMGQAFNNFLNQNNDELYKDQNMRVHALDMDEHPFSYLPAEQKDELDELDDEIMNFTESLSSTSDSEIFSEEDSIISEPKIIKPVRKSPEEKMPTKQISSRLKQAKKISPPPATIRIDSSINFRKGLKKQDLNPENKGLKKQDLNPENDDNMLLHSQNLSEFNESVLNETNPRNERNQISKKSNEDDEYYRSQEIKSIHNIHVNSIQDIGHEKSAKIANLDNSFSILLHITKPRFLGPLSKQFLKFRCKFPFPSIQDETALVHNSEAPIHLLYIKELPLHPLELQNILHERSIAIELITADESDHLGVATISLEEFAKNWQSNTWIANHPVIGFNNDLVIQDLLTLDIVAVAQVFLAFGTEQQIDLLKKSIQFPKISPVIGASDAHEASDLISSKKISVQTMIPTKVSARTQASFPPNNKKFLDQSTSPEVLKSVNPTKPATTKPVATKPSNHPCESMASSSDSLSEKSEKISPIKTVPQVTPQKKEIQHNCILTVRINQATGLSKAVEEASKREPNLKLASLHGPNAFVKFQIFPKSYYRQHIREQMLPEGDYIAETHKFARDFCPTWNYKHQVEYPLNNESYEFMEQKYAVFEVHHSFPQGQSMSGKRGTVLLGRCKVALQELCLNSAGIRKFFTLYKDGINVGALDVAMNLDEKTKRILNVEEMDSEDLQEFIPQKKANVTASTSEIAPKRCSRVTMFVEEAKIPQSCLVQFIPSHMQKELFTCSYFFTYSHANGKEVVSRLYNTSNTVEEISFHHSDEVKMDYNEFMKLRDEKLRVRLYISIKDSKENLRESQMKKSSRCIGCAVIPYKSLINRIYSNSHTKTEYLGGVYQLIDEKSKSLATINLRILWEQCMDNVPSTIEKLKLAKMEYKQQQNFHDQYVDPLDELRQTSEFPKHSTRLKAVNITHTEMPDFAESKLTIDDLGRSLQEKNIDDDLEITFERNHMLTKRKYERTPSNIYHITIHSAIHLPSIKSSEQTMAPNSFVIIMTSNQDSNATTMFHQHSKSNVIPNSQSPKWEYYYRLPIYDDRPLDAIYCQVYHKPPTGRDKIIGDAKVDLELLKYGCDSVEGWFDIQHANQENGLLHVSVKPEHTIKKLENGITLIPDATNRISFDSQIMEPKIEKISDDLHIVEEFSKARNQISIQKESMNKSQEEATQFPEETAEQLRQQLLLQLKDLDDLNLTLTGRAGISYI